MDLLLPDDLDLQRLRDALVTDWEVADDAPTRADVSYHDTFDGLLHRAGWTLAHTAGRLVLQDAEGRERAAVDSPALGKAAFTADLPSGAVRDLVAPLIDVRALLPIARVRSTRTVLRVLDDERKTVVRLMVEQPTVTEAGPLSRRLHVLGVRGYDKALRRVTRTLRRDLGLEPATGSLVDEAVERTGGTPGGVSSKPAVVRDPQERARQAAARVSLSLLRVIEANLPGTLVDLDTEFLHDLRVAVRRTRALQRELAGVFPEDRLPEHRAGFKWLQAVTGPSRDLDVYVLDFDDFRAALPHGQQDDLDPLHTLLVRRRAAAHRQMRRDLRSERTTASLRDWQDLLAALQTGTAGGPDADRPVVELASARIATVHRRMVKMGSAIDDDTPAEALHELRKKGKELRYLLEFFAGLYPAEVIKPMVSALKALQDTLGRFQDREVQADLVRALGEDIRVAEGGTRALMAMGLLVQRLDGQQTQARAEFAERFGRFAAADQRALVKETFR